MKFFFSSFSINQTFSKILYIEINYLTHQKENIDKQIIHKNFTYFFVSSFELISVFAM